MSESTPNTQKRAQKGPAPKAKPKLKDILWQEGSDIAPGQRGPDVIKQFVNTLPFSPGVYRMLNEAGDVLYVGKAKSLKKRVSSYTKLGGHTQRIARMISETSNMEFIVTRTETEALLLEANLIKRLHPRFNVLMRDDKSFPYIFLSTEHDFPRLERHRGAKTRKGRYYGPFANTVAVSRAINSLQKVFLLRTCSDKEVAAGNRACLNYHMKRCAGPCGGKISKEDYAKLITQADDFLRGKTTQVQAQLSQQMQQASDEMDFERAAVLRDRLSALAHIQSHQAINPQGIVEADIFAIHQEYGQSCIQVFFFRTGQNWGNRAYFPRHDASIEANDVLAAFVSQFYDDKPVPRQILLSEEIHDKDLLAEALSEKSQHKVTIDVPKRGGKLDVVSHVTQNARESLGRRISENASQAKLLKGLGEAFSLKETPKRIEIYDNSHISGTNAVGGMVVCGPNGLAKNSYRKFNIKSEDIVPGDDYGMMREVMTRRFSRLVSEHGPKAQQKRDEEGFGPWPDLLLIDGGIGQLNAVLEVLDTLGLREDVPAIGIAKGPERDAGKEKFFMPGKPAFMLPMRDPVLYFVQRLRDEAHRFAIGSHRARRKKQISANPLDEIEGIGPSRKKALLNAFGSAKAVAAASVTDLRKVEGLSSSMAQKIHAHFNENG